MAVRFKQELEEVHGEVVRCGSMEEARAWLAETAAQESWERVGAVDRPLCREVSGGLKADGLAWAQSDWTPQSMASLSAGLVEADCLLADTGTAMVACGRAEERLMCYLPPACVIVATTDRLVEHLPAAWPAIAPRVADPQLRGEFVFITGPSRTADIEKILILGVHGPQRLIVLLVG
jgi:L-lactate dehydrogenase complex protein LldG